jgi:hypothetical protein
VEAIMTTLAQTNKPSALDLLAYRKKLLEARQTYLSKAKKYVVLGEEAPERKFRRRRPDAGSSRAEGTELS